MSNRNLRKQRTGIVISNKMKNTVTVQTLTKMRHPKYQKVVERKTKCYAHDETNSLAVGQKVRVMETRPLSKLKRWRVVEAFE
jgi:small subunit ribosomal protein S17